MIAVTGARGFIGNNLVNKLSKIGTEVLSIDMDNCFDFLNKINPNISMIYHMGAIANTRETDVDAIYRYNIYYSIELFKRCIQCRVPVRYASSASVYGNTHREINPINYYSLSKATVDYWVQDNINRFKLIQGFRFFNVYGNGEEHKQDQASPITKFKKQALEKKEIKIFEGSEFFIRDFICVEDVCEILLNNKKGSGIYDLGTSNPVSFRKIADIIQEKYGGKITTIPMPKDLIAKYQTYTKADDIWDFKFKTVRQWLDNNDLISSAS